MGRTQTSRRDNARSVEAEVRPTRQRLEASSDGVFAIVATIMMFEVSVPNKLASSLDATILSGFAGSIVTYALSYLVIFTLWMSHHYLVLTVRQPDRNMVWLNGLMLFFVSLIPMAARFFGSKVMSANAAALYGLVLLFCTASFGFLRVHAIKLAEEELHRSIHRQVLRKIWLTVAVYAASIPLSLLDVRLSWVCFLITPVMFFVPVVRASGRLR
ncbi:TMEM175 family protein [Sphingomonas tabacisoli]|uniref:TMEM175 family protein n=1 Tax=Sphingomonas tabacisoli TaxID=2249466 RepID=A0ABW4I5H7_9SPHN